MFNSDRLSRIMGVVKRTLLIIDLPKNFDAPSLVKYFEPISKIDKAETFMCSQTKRCGYVIFHTRQAISDIKSSDNSKFHSTWFLANLILATKATESEKKYYNISAPMYRTPKTHTNFALPNLLPHSDENKHRFFNLASFTDFNLQSPKGRLAACLPDFTNVDICLSRFFSFYHYDYHLISITIITFTPR